MRIHTLDLHFQETPGTIACYLVEGATGLALIETGPGSTLANLLDGISGAGFDPDEIRDIFVTHIHLDHAGSAGWWGRNGARIHVHPRGARHLADPSRLIAGATAIYGNRTETLWGEILSVPEEMIIPVNDAECIAVGDIRLTAMDSPGHARHHHCWVLEEQKIAFTGDSTNVRLGSSNHISLASAPPQFEPSVFDATLERLAAAQFETIYPTHFGAVEDVEDYLERCRHVVRDSTEFVFTHLRNGLDEEAIIEQFEGYARKRFEHDGCAAALWQDYQLINPASMCARGVLIHCRAQLDAESDFISHP